MDGIASADIGRFASEQANKRLGRLAFEISRVVKSPDPEAVHDLRVAIRRFSQALRVFKGGFRGKEIRKIRRDLKRMMVLAGDARNCDIALKLLSKFGDGRQNDTGSKLQRSRREFAQALVAMSRSWLEQKESRKWRADLKISWLRADESFRNTSIAETCRQMLPGMVERFFEIGDGAARLKASPAELHQFRIAAKKLRYSLELFISLHGSLLKPGLEKIKRAQDLLGDINDCETVRAMISKYKGVESFLAWLKKRQRRRILQFQRYWMEAFASETELHNWIELLSRGSQQVRKPAARTEAVRSRSAVA